MKRLAFIIISCLLLTSCSVLLTREMQKNVLVIDFRPYSDAGIFLSPGEYPGAYTPVGLLDMIVDPAVIRTNSTNEDGFEDGIYTEVMPEVMPVPILSKELLDMAVHEALERGANGIANLKLEVRSERYAYKRYNSIFSSGDLTIPVEKYFISGFLIKIPNE